MARRRETLNIWPGFVDALATLLLVFVFVLSLFVVAQFYLSDALSGSQEAVRRLQADIDRLAETLAMERRRGETLSAELGRLEEELSVTIAERERQLLEIASLQQDIDALRELREKLEAQVGELAAALETRDETIGQLRDRSKALTAALAEAEEHTQLAQTEIAQREIRIEELEQARLSAQDQIEQLNRQIAALREQIGRLAAALEVSEQTVAEQQVEIDELGRKLNLALVEKVQELNRYRSEFFGRLREVLGEREDIRIVGDRFVLQSELLFETASAELEEGGRESIARIATTLSELAESIPEDIDWVLQVEGHTDRRPIDTEEFPSNWELSTARANSIVHFLVERGIPPQRLAAAGFAEFQPVDDRNTPEAWRRNRRIELKLTSR